MPWTTSHLGSVAAVTLCGLTSATLWADEPSRYYALHKEPQHNLYRAADGSYVEEWRTGLQRAWDLTDPKVLCGKEAGPCDTTERSFAIRVEDRLLQRFKVFVPPGAKYVQIMLYLYQNSQTATVSRFNQPPTGDYRGWSFSDFPMDPDTGGKLAELTAADYLTRIHDGHSTVVNQYFNPPLAQGGWIYVQVLSYDGAVPIENRYTARLDVATYVDWYRGVDWAVFNAEENGTGVPVCTDSDHDTYGSGCAAGPDCNDNNAAVHPGATEVCNGIDDNCAGGIDEIGCAGCTDGDGDTYGQGCPAGADCNDQNAAVHPGATEKCNGVDDNCNNATDETWSNLGAACTAGQGACKATGVVVCAAGGAGVVCSAAAGQPAPEVCDDTVDNDCDGLTDQADADCDTCVNGSTEACYSGPWQTQNVGDCRAGERRCAEERWGPCEDQTLPLPESCGDDHDNDCDGRTDSADADCGPCQPGSQAPCYDGPTITAGVGECHAGQALCLLGQYMFCQNQVTPKAEICTDHLDNDCDGAVDAADDDCPGCESGTASACYTGLPATKNVGECHAGEKTCVGGSWGACVGEQRPEPEACGDLLDNDCDGEIDNDDRDCWDCVADEVEACYLGPSGTVAVGLCNHGERRCGSEGWGGCEGQVLPEVEVCDDGEDNDCDGATDAADTGDCDEAIVVNPKPEADPDPVVGNCASLGGAAGQWPVNLLPVWLALALVRRKRRSAPRLIDC